MHEAGITNAVATLGTALTAKHIKLLSRHAGKKIVYMFDGDTAGQRATDRALQFIDESFASAGPGRIDLCALTLPDGLDPAEFLAKYDGPTLNQMIAEAPSLLMFGIERRLAKYDLSSVEDKYRALADALSILAPIKRTLMAKDYAVKVAGMLGLDEADVLDQLMATPVPVASLPQNREADYPRSLGSASKSGTLRAPDGTQSDYPPADIDAACGAPSDIQAFDVPAVKLPTSEVNRLKLEREILSLAAQYPSTAIRFAPDLQACAWHDSLHAHLAGAILNTLVNNPMADAAAMVEAAMSVDDRAGSILTSALCEPEAATARMSMLINQLKRGDLQQKIREGKARLQTLPPDAQQTEFAQLVALQNQLAAMDAQID
jgi:DNA primase